MTEQAELIAQEREALLALEQIRAAVAAIPPGHPPTRPLAEALTLAERHWQECQNALVAATKAIEDMIEDTGADHPNDYWSARWRT